MSKIAKLMIILTIGLFGARANAQDLPEPGVWRYEKVIDEFTDEVSHHLFLTANQTFASGEKVVMNIYCRSNRTFVAIYTGTHTLNKTQDADDYWDTDYRLDDQKAQTFKVTASHAAFTPHPFSTHIPLIKSFFGHDKLRMRFETSDGTRPTATLNITGIEEEIKPIREACNW